MFIFPAQANLRNILALVVTLQGCESIFKQRPLGRASGLANSNNFASSIGSEIFKINFSHGAQYCIKGILNQGPYITG